MAPVARVTLTHDRHQPGLEAAPPRRLRGGGSGSRAGDCLGARSRNAVLRRLSRRASRWGSAQIPYRGQAGATEVVTRGDDDRLGRPQDACQPQSSRSPTERRPENDAGPADTIACDPAGVYPCLTLK